MGVPTIAVAVLGGAFDSEELGDNDIEPVAGMLDTLQQQMVTGFSDVHIELIDRAHFDRVTAERDTLNARLTAADEHNDRLISAINKVRNSIGLPASIEAVLIAALDRKEKN